MNSLQAAGFPLAYTDLTNAWVNFELPFLPMSVLREAHKKNVAALTSASQVVIECLQTLAQHHAQFIKSTIDEYSKVAGDILAGTVFEQTGSRIKPTLAGTLLAICESCPTSQ